MQKYLELLQKSAILRDKTMVHILLYIANDDTQNHHFCRLQLVVESKNTKNIEPANQNSVKVPKLVKPTSKKMLL